MTNATAAAPTVSDADMLEILTAREAARLMVETARNSGLSHFHFAHALLSEGIALGFGGNIDASRIAATAFITGFVNAAQADPALKNSSEVPAAPVPSDNVVSINRSES